MHTSSTSPAASSWSRAPWPPHCRDGRLAGAGLDVFEVEPLPADSELRELNVVLGSHNGSNTREGVERASQRAVDIMLEELENLAP